MIEFNVLLLPPRKVLYTLYWDCCFAQHQSAARVSAVTLTLDTNIRQPSKGKVKNGALTQSHVENFRTLNYIYK